MVVLFARAAFLMEVCVSVFYRGCLLVVLGGVGWLMYGRGRMMGWLVAIGGLARRIRWHRGGERYLHNAY
jgi:hypothetical protein